MWLVHKAEYDILLFPENSLKSQLFKIFKRTTRRANVSVWIKNLNFLSLKETQQYSFKYTVSNIIIPLVKYVHFQRTFEEDSFENQDSNIVCSDTYWVAI